MMVKGKFWPQLQEGFINHIEKFNLLHQLKIIKMMRIKAIITFTGTLLS